MDLENLVKVAVGVIVLFVGIYFMARDGSEVEMAPLRALDGHWQEVANADDGTEVPHEEACEYYFSHGRLWVVAPGEDYKQYDWFVENKDAKKFQMVLKIKPRGGGDAGRISIAFSENRQSITLSEIGSPIFGELSRNVKCKRVDFKTNPRY